MRPEKALNTRILLLAMKWGSSEGGIPSRITELTLGLAGADEVKFNRSRRY